MLANISNLKAFFDFLFWKNSCQIGGRIDQIIDPGSTFITSNAIYEISMK
jgi:hypothetical protein